MATHHENKLYPTHHSFFQCFLVSDAAGWIIFDKCMFDGSFKYQTQKAKGKQFLFAVHLYGFHVCKWHSEWQRAAVPVWSRCGWWRRCRSSSSGIWMFAVLGWCGRSAGAAAGAPSRQRLAYTRTTEKNHATHINWHQEPLSVWVCHVMTSVSYPAAVVLNQVQSDSSHAPIIAACVDLQQTNHHQPHF